MKSNTKLTKTQKQGLKNFKGANPTAVFARSNAVTVLLAEDFPGSNVLRLSVSVCSPKEKKNRRKVGQYYAMLGESVPVPRYPSLDMEAQADVLAEYINPY